MDGSWQNDYKHEGRWGKKSPKKRSQAISLCFDIKLGLSKFDIISLRRSFADRSVWNKEVRHLLMKTTYQTWLATVAKICSVF